MDIFKRLIVGLCLCLNLMVKDGKFIVLGRITQGYSNSGKYVGILDDTNKYTWEEAKDYCRNDYGTDLASIHSSSDENDANTIFRGIAWVGLNDINNEDNWEWSDNTNYDYLINWEPGQPTSGSGQDCVRIRSGGSGARFRDVLCDKEIKKFICNSIEPTPQPTPQPTSRVLQLTSCETKKSIKSGTNDNDPTSVSCEGTGKTLVGCSWQTDFKNSNGAYMQSTGHGRCFARNGPGGGGVYAYARCCDVHATCNSHGSAISGNGDDDGTSDTCDNGSVLTSCISRTLSRYMDGAYAVVGPGVNRCIAHNGNGGTGVFAELMCCQSDTNYELRCTTTASDKSGTSDDDKVSVECPNGFFLSGCSSFTHFKNMDGSWFENNRCWAQNGHSGGGVRAMAICCQEFYIGPNRRLMDRLDTKE